MAKLTTTVSFKENERHIYDFLKTKRNQSVFIKDLIEAYMNGQLLANTIINQPTQLVQNSSDNKEEDSKMDVRKLNMLKNVNVWEDEEE